MRTLGAIAGITLNDRVTSTGISESNAHGTETRNVLAGITKLNTPDHARKPRRPPKRWDDSRTSSSQEEKRQQ